MVITVQIGATVVVANILSPVYHGLQPNWSCEKPPGPVDSIASSSNVPSSADSNTAAVVKNCSCPLAWRHYENTDSFHSLSRQFSLICEDAWKFKLFDSLLLVGAMVGSLTFGHLADRFGRKWIGVVTMSGTSLISFIFMWSANYIMAAVFMSLVAFFGGGHMVVGVATMIEYVGRDYRLLVYCLDGWSYAFMLMALLGYITKSWNYYHMALSICGIPVILAWIFTLESPRWLIQRNRVDEAKKSINTIALWNRVPSPLLANNNQLLSVLNQAESVDRKTLRNYNYFDLAKHPLLRLCTFVMIFAYFTSGLVSWGIYSNLHIFSGSSIYINLFFTGLGKAIGSTIPLILDACRLGRRTIILTLTAVICVYVWCAVAVFCYLGEKPSEGSLGNLFRTFVIIGAAATDPAWKLNHLYTTELFPTVVRCMAMGVCHFAARLAVVGPGLLALEAVYLPAPYIICGIFTLVEFGILNKFLPEYRGTPLLDNLAELKPG